MKPDAFVKSLDDERIVAAIGEAEARSRGEVRVHVAVREVADSRRDAEEVFDRLGMNATAERSGVLVYVAPERQVIVVLGDQGIHGCCGEAFWVEVVAGVRGEFAAGRFTEGIVSAVRAVGDALALHFPRRAEESDRNELPDAVSRG